MAIFVQEGNKTEPFKILGVYISVQFYDMTFIKVVNRCEIASINYRIIIITKGQDYDTVYFLRNSINV